MPNTNTIRESYQFLYKNGFHQNSFSDLFSKMDAIEGLGLDELINYIFEQPYHQCLLTLPSGDTPIIAAIEQDKWDLAEVFLDNIKKYIQEQKKVNTYYVPSMFLNLDEAIYLCLEKNNKEFIDKILTIPNIPQGYCSGVKRTKGYGALHLAVERDDHETIVKLVKYGHNINIDYGQGCPIEIAAKNYKNKSKTLKLLLQLGANRGALLGYDSFDLYCYSRRIVREAVLKFNQKIFQGNQEKYLILHDGYKEALEKNIKNQLMYSDSFIEYLFFDNDRKNIELINSLRDKLINFVADNMLITSGLKFLGLIPAGEVIVVSKWLLKSDIIDKHIMKNNPEKIIDCNLDEKSNTLLLAFNSTPRENYIKSEGMNSFNESCRYVRLKLRD